MDVVYLPGRLSSGCQRPPAPIRPEQQVVPPQRKKNTSRITAIRAAIFALAPLCGIYYPIATLPGWLQPLAWILPASHVFEGMRAVLLDHMFRLDYFLYALLLNTGYLGLAIGVFLAAVRHAREHGSLLQSGE